MSKKIVKMFKKFIFFSLTTLLATILSLEFISSIIYFILIVLISGFIVAVIFKGLKHEISYTTIRKLCFLSLFSSYLLFAAITTFQRDVAFDKISSIPKENLKRFYELQEISIIPKDSRYTWMGCWYRQIRIIPEEKFQTKNTKVVGWKHNGIAAYYNLTDDRFGGSYH